MRSRLLDVRGFPALGVLCALSTLAAPRCAPAEPSPAAVVAFNDYVRTVESRLAKQHKSTGSFLVPVTSASQSEIQPRSEDWTGKEPMCGEPVVQRLTLATGLPLPGATLYHWRGAAFVQGAKAADFERLMKDLGSYPKHFSPQVLRAHVLSQDGDHLQASMRIRQQHVLTVVLDITYDIAFARLDAQHGYSLSRSTQIAEIAAPGTLAEHALDASHEHGFLWRQNTYWSYEERNGGLYMQIESVSLTRPIPTGLGWAIGSYVESIPRESLEFTLRATCNALRH
jgi:hypothetical protein